MKAHCTLFSALFAALLIFTGCSPSMSVRLQSDSTVTMSFESGTGTELSKTFTALTGKEMGGIQTAPTVRAMKAAGLTATAVTQQGSQFLLATGPDPLADILTDCPGALTVQNGTAGRPNELTFALSPETAQYIVSLLPEETASYTELFMAPLFTGEIMSAEEYTGLIAAVYGYQLAEELEESQFSLSISVPGTITSVTLPAPLNATAVKLGGNARISIPLSSLLTLSDTQSILVIFQ